MNKCLRIIFSTKRVPEGFLRSIVQKDAQKLGIEGIAQLVITDQKVRIVACGLKENIDKFIDMLHKRFFELSVQDVEIEPFIKDRDYRNVFRVIE